MRHGKKFNHLSRTASHRAAMLSNMACSLIKHKRITTTLAKAKALKQYVEPLLFGVDKDSEEYLEAKRLLKFFDYFVGIGSEYIPTNSLLREFIGGGCFHV